jgi:ribosomal protein S27E
MKKISIISFILIIVAVLVMAFTFQNPVNTIGSPNETVHFIVVNCDDCTNLKYCINGGKTQFVNNGSCEFDITVPYDPPIIYTICVICGTRKGTATYDYASGTVKVYVSDAGVDCKCK